MESFGTRTLAGMLWSFTERFSVQGVNFIILIIMARMLTPADYGLVGMIGIFIAIAQGIADFGFTQGLIRCKERSATDTSTVFWFNILAACLLYAILWITAGGIAEFYQQPVLVEVTRAVGLAIPLGAVTVVPKALLCVKLDFRSQALAGLISAILSGGLGVMLAAGGFGVWSIVWYQVVNAGLIAAILWLVSEWRPELRFSISSFRSLAGFSSRLAVAGFMETVYVNLYGLVIGKFYNASDLGYYSRANQLCAFLSSNISNVVQRVSYPTLCNLQEEVDNLRFAFIRFLRLGVLIVFTLMGVLAVVAGPLVEILLTDKWEFAAKLVPILCLSLMWYPVQALNLNLLQVGGRSDLFLRLEVWKKIISVVILCATVPLGIEAICWGRVADSLISLRINSLYTVKCGGVALHQQFRYMLPALLYAITTAGITYFLTILFASAYLKLVVGLCGGVTWFILITHFTDSLEMRTAERLLRGLLTRHSDILQQ